MPKSKTITNAMLPMRILNWIMGCGGIIEYPLGNPHINLSFAYSSVCAVNYCLLTYLSVYYINQMSSDLYNGNDDSDKTFFKAFFYANVVITFSTIWMGWNRTKVSFKLIYGLIVRNLLVWKYLFEGMENVHAKVGKNG